MNLIWAFVRNCGNQSPRCKGRNPNGRIHEGESTDARNWGGPTRMSEERPVMGLEQRGWVRQSKLRFNCSENRRRS